MLKSLGCSVVNLFPQEVPWVPNLFPRELIEGPPQDFPQENPLLHLWPDPRPKTLRACSPSGFWPLMQPQVGLQKILWGALNQLPREKKENSRDFPRFTMLHPRFFNRLSHAFGFQGLDSGSGAFFVKKLLSPKLVINIKCQRMGSCDRKFGYVIFSRGKNIKMLVVWP